MRNVFVRLEYWLGNFVICGSWALYLQGIVSRYNPKEIDVICNVNKDRFDNLWYFKKHTSNRFNSQGWSTSVEDVNIDIFNKPLPEYDIISFEDYTVKVKSIKALEEHYKSIDISQMTGNEKFLLKIQDRVKLFSRSYSL